MVLVSVCGTVVPRHRSAGVPIVGYLAFSSADRRSRPVMIELAASHHARRCLGRRLPWRGQSAEAICPTVGTVPLSTPGRPSVPRLLWRRGSSFGASSGRAPLSEAGVPSRRGELKRLRRRKSASPKRNTDRRVARRSADIWLRSGVMVGKTADQLGYLGDDGRCQPIAVRFSSS